MKLKPIIASVVGSMAIACAAICSVGRPETSFNNSLPFFIKGRQAKIKKHNYQSNEYLRDTLD